MPNAAMLRLLISDYRDALKVLKRFFKRRSAVIYVKRGYAGKELIPSQTRPTITVPSLASAVTQDATPSSGNSKLTSESDPAVVALNPPSVTVQPPSLNALEYFQNLQQDTEIHAPPLPTTTRFITVAYTNASFAVCDFKDSISGLVIYVNGTPIL